MAMQQGLSGLNAATKALDVISNNIANSNTVGFKSGNARFSSVFAAAGSSLDAGLGVQVNQINTSFGQGNFTSTGNPLDVAIGGNGFFIVNDKGVESYTRNGQMSIDKDGYLVNSAGNRYRGFALDADGNVDTSRINDLRMSFNDQPPLPTGEAMIQINFPAGETIKDPTLFDVNDPQTYNNATSMTIYDSLGTPKVATYYFIKTGNNLWEGHVSIEGTDYGKIGELNFNPDGSLDQANSDVPMTITFTNTNGSYNPSTFKLNLGTSTQYAGAFSVNMLDQNGYSASRLVDYSIDTEGKIFGKYSNGNMSLIGQIALAKFVNVQGLQAIGNNRWVETGTSGVPIIGKPGSSGTGSISSGTVEDSNVDMTAELVGMITQQRLYQANSQTIKTNDQMLQSLLNLR